MWVCYLIKDCEISSQEFCGSTTQGGIFFSTGVNLGKYLLLETTRKSLPEREANTEEGRADVSRADELNEPLNRVEPA